MQRHAAWHLLLIAWLAFLRLGCSQTSCAVEKLLLKVGKEEATITVPVLDEGANRRWACAEFFPGYASFIEVSCLGGLLHADVSRCTPKGCEAGTQAPARIGGVNATLYVTVVSALEHGQDAQVPCNTILDGYKEVVGISCRSGKVEADAGKCRPAFGSASTVYRIVNGDFLPGTWRVFELSFYTMPDCQGGKLEGAPVASSEYQEKEGWKTLAFDKKLDTAWSANCELGCQADTAWVGLTLPQPSANVRCVQLRQSAVRCCGSDRVRLEVWDGSMFQNMQVWDTSPLVMVRGHFVLPVPITCKEGKPEGEGVIHDCEGPAVVGRQSGDICTAECESGYYGTPEPFLCQPDGVLVGNAPTCYQLSLWFRITGLVSFWGTLIFLAWQYRFWCMYKKVRLTDEEVVIPKVMKGMWLEKGRRNVWDDMVEAIKNKEKQNEVTIGKQMEEMQAKRNSVESSSSVHVAVAVTSGSTIDVGGADELEEMANMVMVKGKIKEIPPQTDGLCTPCEDPDLCWTCLLCPICRIADTWHTLGTPKGLTYGRVFLMYLCCPWCWPCLNFYGRLRIRFIFGLPVEPHRDCLAHCCCCCCSPCAICQEARLADAPTQLASARRKNREVLDRMD